MERRRFVAGAFGAASGLVVAGGAGQAWARPGPTAPRAGALAEWSAVPSPGSEPGAHLRGVAALGPRAAWAVGEEARPAAGQRGRPLAMRWDGSAWAKADTSGLKFTGGLLSVAATAPDAVWAVGSAENGSGRLVRWNGTAWRPVDHPGSGSPDTVLWAVAAGSGREVWVTGRQAGAVRLLHWNGKRWKWLAPLPVDQPDAASLGSVTVGPGGVVWACGSQATGSGVWGGLVARWDGAWTVLPSVGGIRSGISDVLAVADDDVWGVGAAFGVGGPPGKPPGSVLAHWDGTAWTYVDDGIGPGALLGITADDAGRPAWICGWEFWDQKRSAYLRWDGTNWQLVRGPAGDAAPTPYMYDVTRVPGTSAYLSVGRTGASENPPSTAYSEMTPGA
ncbi:hypothetical protein GCM10009801_66940 [Streptomyces albiaxialis]|uniref:LigA protein n=1 Tax=Streptomyces albiaxialis TaxID=329523 RepID=A0ABN2WSP1_9ACTN